MEVLRDSSMVSRRDSSMVNMKVVEMASRKEILWAQQLVLRTAQWKASTSDCYLDKRTKPTGRMMMWQITHAYP